MENKKIGILTQPLHQNYGGLLQAYALQSVLKRLDCTPYILNVHPFEEVGLIRKVASTVKTLIDRNLLKKQVNYNFLFNLKQNFNQEIYKFKEEYITPKSPEIRSMESFISFVESINFNTYVVGSDQVWRPLYSPYLPLYFLSFLEDDKSVKKISYAASFGVDQWEFNKGQTAMAQRLVCNFNAVSVREDSAVELCKKYLNVQADHVLDPTMLLTKEDYLDMLVNFNDDVNREDIFTYILDQSSEKDNLIKKISKDYKLHSFSLNPKVVPYRINRLLSITLYEKRSVLSWIKSIADAEYIITDSFHGCVFAIIFNKPFIAIGNKSRGYTRFESLLRAFNLTERLNPSSFGKPINWDEVNATLNTLRDKSLHFLMNNI